jgi:4-amino-4-deoxy-L-arabinose transferase-like glycosyltransferase
MAAGAWGIGIESDGEHAAPIAADEPRRTLVLALLAAFVALWTAYFAISDAGSAIHHDMAEAYVWGREFQFGYNQHPPFWAWICGLWFWVLPRAGWSFALLSSLNAGLGLVGSWMLVGNFASGSKRIGATTLLLLTPFYTILAYKYNANSIFLSLWPWTLHFFVRSIEGRRLGDSLLFGLFMGLALMSKYYALILAATCLLAALQHPARRRYFASPSPYVAAGVAAALCAPHLWWLATSGAPPVRYLASASGRGLGATAGYAAATFFGALAQNGIVIALVAFAARTSPGAWLDQARRQWRAPRFRMMAVLALAPLGLTILAALVLRTKVSTNMTIGVFSLIPLLAMDIAGGASGARLGRLAPRLAAALCLGALALSPAIGLAKAWLASDGAATQPRRELAAEATRLWRQATPAPLSYVAGSFAYDNSVAFYSEERPHAFERFDFSRNRWVTPGALAEHGLLAVCVAADVACLAAARQFATPDSIRTELSLAHTALGHSGAPVGFVVTAIPPQAR